MFVLISEIFFSVFLSHSRSIFKTYENIIYVQTLKKYFYYNPNSRNVGTFFFFFFIKSKLKEFKIPWANILFTIEHR